MSTIEGKRTPRPGSEGRATRKPTPMDGAAGRSTGTPRGKYPKEGFPQPEVSVRKGGGDPMSTTLVNRQEVGPAVRKGDGSGKPAGSTKFIPKG